MVHCAKYKQSDSGVVLTHMYLKQAIVFCLLLESQFISVCPGSSSLLIGPSFTRGVSVWMINSVVFLFVNQGRISEAGLI